MKEKQFKFELGSTVKDKIDGFEGIVSIQMRNITGCLQYAIFGKTFSSGDRHARFWVDESLLELLDEPIIKLKE
jgi:hypothetical protein